MCALRERSPDTAVFKGFTFCTLRREEKLADVRSKGENWGDSGRSSGAQGLATTAAEATPPQQDGRPGRVRRDAYVRHIDGASMGSRRSHGSPRSLMH